MSTKTRTTTRTEWAVRYGDGEVDGPHFTYAAARSIRKDIRDAIRSGEVDRADYEPIRLVRRKVTTTITPWEDSHR